MTACSLFVAIDSRSDVGKVFSGNRIRKTYAFNDSDWTREIVKPLFSWLSAESPQKLDGDLFIETAPLISRVIETKIFFGKRAAILMELPSRILLRTVNYPLLEFSYR